LKLDSREKGLFTEGTARLRLNKRIHSAELNQMNVLSKEMNVFRTYIHFGLCTTLPDRPSVDQQLKSEDSQNSVSKEQSVNFSIPR
jgi:hypothetical protein